MTKTQLLILLCLIALAFYLNSESKPSPKPKKETWIFKPSQTTSPQPTSPTQFPDPPKLDIPISPSPISSPKILSPETTSDETYRVQCLTLLETWQEQFTNPQQSSSLTPIISLFSTPNQPRSAYLQALWRLRGLAGWDLLFQASFQAWVNLPAPPTNSWLPSWLTTDTSWLTDDNLEFILSNWTPIQKALKSQTSRKFHLRTDIANIYCCFYNAQSNQDWDLPEFLQELELDKHQYTLFPLRVNGNHWGLFILKEEEKTEPEESPEPGVIYFPSASFVQIITKVFYTSSGGVNLETEKQQLQPFINQLIGENTPITIIHPKDRNSQGYECGVYLAFYIQEILETGKLELHRSYTSEQCQEFRREWKARIGEKWGRWD